MPDYCKQHTRDIKANCRLRHTRLVTYLIFETCQYKKSKHEEILDMHRNGTGSFLLAKSVLAPNCCTALKEDAVANRINLEASFHPPTTKKKHTVFKYLFHVITLPVISILLFAAATKCTD